MFGEKFLPVDQSEVFHWGVSHERQIVAALELERILIALRHHQIGSEAPEYLDYRSRVLAEMPLCCALKHITPPQGYAFVAGAVLCTFNGEDEETDHRFFYQPETDEVCCLTAGQFVEDRDISYGPGDRIAELANLYPQGVYQIGRHTAVLQGTRLEIRDRLGLLYIAPTLR